jgi:hypothetical protein
MAKLIVPQSDIEKMVEPLLAEIASVAYMTEEGLRGQSSDGSLAATTAENEMLRHTVARMGWMADVLLHRLESINCMREGNAASWLLPPTCTKAMESTNV